ncbi:MAG: hypothetical protein IH897_05755 [Planctomycetes bacterium]|nr:hypothetical protein [Planctomycetota bacterium]
MDFLRGKKTYIIAGLMVIVSIVKLISGDMTIVEAVTLAGGFTKIAAPDAVQVTRMVDGQGQTHTVSLDRIVKGQAPNFGLAPGDIVFVPESIF